MDADSDTTEQYSTPESSSDTSVKQRPAYRLELAFEYLVARDTLKWITIVSDQVDICNVVNLKRELSHQCSVNTYARMVCSRLSLKSLAILAAGSTAKH